MSITAIHGNPKSWASHFTHFHHQKLLGDSKWWASNTRNWWNDRSCGRVSEISSIYEYLLVSTPCAGGRLLIEPMNYKFKESVVKYYSTDQINPIYYPSEISVIYQISRGRKWHSTWENPRSGFTPRINKLHVDLIDRWTNVREIWRWGWSCWRVGARPRC